MRIVSLAKSVVSRRIGADGPQPVLRVSRLSYEKRLEVLIRSFDGAATRFPNTLLLIGGSGPDRSALEALAKQMPNSDKIIFTGFIEESELLDYYAACDVFASPAWADFDIAP